MKKVVIIDDEQSGRTLIRQYLEDYPDLIIVGEANNGVDAIKVINEFQPDLAFLDIQMPGMTGFEVLGHLKELPQIIFSTAYDAYALQAFEVHAVDYLLKPYTRERFAKSISKISEQSTERLAPLADSVMMSGKEYPERVLVEHGKKYITLPVTDIHAITAYGDYSRIHSGEEVYLSTYGISELVEKLNPAEFMRVHRSSVVNMAGIAEIQKEGKGYMIRLVNGQEVRVSRGYAEKVRGLIV